MNEAPDSQEIRTLPREEDHIKTLRSWRCFKAWSQGQGPQGRSPALVCPSPGSRLRTAALKLNSILLNPSHSSFPHSFSWLNSSFQFEAIFPTSHLPMAFTMPQPVFCSLDLHVIFIITVSLLLICVSFNILSWSLDQHIMLAPSTKLSMLPCLA